MGWSMAEVWLIAAVICGLLEAVTVSLVSIWFMAGTAVSFLTALVAPESVTLQVAVFAAVSLLSIVFFRPVAKKYVDKYAKKGGNINSKVDKNGIAVKDIIKGEKGRVKIGDVEWTAVTYDDLIPAGAKIKVVSVDGNTLTVKKNEEG